MVGQRFLLSLLAIFLLGIAPSVVPVGNSVAPASGTSSSRDQYLELPDNADSVSSTWDGIKSATGDVIIPSQTDFTAEVWVHPDSLDNPSVWHQLFQQGADWESNFGRFGLNLKTADKNSTAG
ncbi:hypothetical protein, partial [Pontimonas sp.]|uniref:hypothetical protein n=1 Tax=Pontimonas sp. TaxID=2304492 RepID=UPI0028707008